MSLARGQAFLFSVLALLGGMLAGCATYQAKVQDARQVLPAQPTKAVELLEPLAKQEGKDQLIYLLDYAVALQQSGRYKESAKAFYEAEKIADIQDYTSLSKQASSLLLSQEMVQYKGDDFEKVLINGMNSLNYLMLGDLDEAAVEVRRLNQKLYKFKYEAKRNYQQNPYAFYLSAMVWEADRKWDDAYIDYKHAYEVAPDYPPLREDLVRAAIRAQRPEEADKWRKQFPEVKVRPEWKDPNMGEIVFIHVQGWGPRKQPRPENFRFPMLVPVYTQTQAVDLELEPVTATPTAEKSTIRIPGQSVFSVQNVAIKTLDDDYGSLVAKRLAGVVTKAVVADQLRQKNEALGLLALVALNATDRADLRQWSTLPQSFQIARSFVKAGRYRLRALGKSGGGAMTGENLSDTEVEIKPGRKTFYAWRSFR